MATTTETAVVPIPRVETLPEQRIALRGVSWETFERLVEEVGDITTLMAYNRGVLEFMSPGPSHEDWKTRLGRLVEVVTEEFRIPCKGLGSTHWKRPLVQRAVEADECYLLTAEKLAAWKRREANVAETLSPDLAIEIDISKSAVDRAEIYATLGVAEVWRFDGETLRIDRLRDDGAYEAVGDSQLLPISPAEVARWLQDETDVDDSAWSRRLRAWVRAELIPRRGGNGGS
jgi:Uma2 family endonuclease